MTNFDREVLHLHHSSPDELKKSAELLARSQKGLPVRPKPTCMLDAVTTAAVVRHEIEMELVWSISVDLCLIAPWFMKLRPEEKLFIGGQLKSTVKEPSLAACRHEIEGLVIYTAVVQTRFAVHAIDFGFDERARKRAKKPAIIALKATSTRTPETPLPACPGG